MWDYTLVGVEIHCPEKWNLCCWCFESCILSIHLLNTPKLWLSIKCKIWPNTECELNEAHIISAVFILHLLGFHVYSLFSISSHWKLLWKRDPSDSLSEIINHYSVHCTKLRETHIGPWQCLSFINSGLFSFSVYTEIYIYTEIIFIYSIVHLK